MNTIEKIRQKIEELYDGEAPAHDQQCEFEDGYFTGIGAISNFIDSLQQEQPEVDCDELEKISEKYAEKMNVSKGWFDGGEIDDLIKESFEAGAEWQYQKDRGEFAKLKAKEWCNGYDDAISQFVKIPYEPRDWFSSGDGDFICGASFDEAIPAKVELYYRTKSEEK